MQIMEAPTPIPVRSPVRTRVQRSPGSVSRSHLRLVPPPFAEVTPLRPPELSWLSKRELEVLALMARGLSDRGIAQELWVTPKTVESHTRSIFRKLRLPAGGRHNRRVAAVVTYLSEWPGGTTAPGA